MSGTVAPGPRGSPITGVGPLFRRDPLGYSLELRERYGPIVRMPFPFLDAYLVASPTGVRRVLQDNDERYGRATRGVESLRGTLGNGLLTTTGDFWRRQRRIAQPAFHRARIAGFAATMASAADELVARWEAIAGRDEPVDLVPELLRVTLQILGRCLFGRELGTEAPIVGDALEVVLRRTIGRAQASFVLPAGLAVALNRPFRRAMRDLDRIVLGLIEERRREGTEGRGDLLSMLIDARDDGGVGMTDQQLRDEVMTLFLAGHETTAMSLGWTFVLLSQNPLARRALTAELDRQLGTGPATPEVLLGLPYVRMVLEESMRVYPPAWIVTRSVEQDDELDGFALRKGSLVLLSPWVTHRDPSLWPNPEGFDPQRFAPDAPERPRYAYFPFGGGPHLCIGAPFAMMEAQIVLATIARRYDLDLVPGQHITPEPLVTLRPKPRVLVRVRPR